MKLDFIPIDKLFVDKANMRAGRKPPDIADILPSIRARGILQSLIVRPDGGDRFGIVAGNRRFHAAGIVAAERAAEAAAAGVAAEPFPVPCAILGDGDDAAALEASLIENLARLDPDEVTQWESFVRLVKAGKAVADIAATFGLPELTVRRVLALGNLLPRIRALYRAEEIDAATVRHLTLASKRQQRDWLALVDDPQAHAPTGHRLKAWLFGGQAIPVAHALFDLDGFAGAVTADLFGEDRYFADPDRFWAAQDAAIETRRAAYLEAGWREVVVVPPDQHFQLWEHQKTPKRDGGRVYADVRATGEVVFHEGYVTRREARARERGAEVEAATPARGEITTPLRAYIDLHRHAAVRAALLRDPKAALRLMVAHAIVGSHLWRVSAEPQAARGDAIRESVETSRGEAVFDEKRRAVLALLGFDPETPRVVGGDDGAGVAGLFRRLLDLPDRAVIDMVAVVMGETLAAGSVAVEAAGLHLGLDMAAWWQPDDALLDLVRDKEVLQCLVAEVAGETVAAANAGETGKVMRRIVADHLAGRDGRPKVEAWVPRWMRFPPAAYTARGGVATVEAHARLGTATEPAEPQEAEPARLAA